MSDMSDIKQVTLFHNSGLNTDDSNLFKALGDSEYRLHVLIGEEGQNGVVTNMKGNTVATYPLTLSNAYQVGGSYYNQLQRKVYYLIFSQPYDSDGSGDYIYDNHLLEFNEDTELIENIYTDTKNYFGIDAGYRVCDWDMIGNYLYFNPRVSEPKMIDVVRAKNYTTYEAWQDTPQTYVYGEKVRYFGGVFVANTTVGAGESPVTHYTKWDRIGDCYQDETDLSPVFDNEFRYAFHVIKHVPVSRPVCAYATDADKNANNVRGKLFRFTQRYKYFDDTYSRFGAFSDITLPLYDEYYNGEVPGDLDQFNCIDVTIPLHSASLIKEIEIAFQETGMDWKRAKIINRQDITLLNQITYTYRFYNTDSAYELISESYFNEAFDSVPRTANTQELINKNIITYGGITEGFNNLDKNDIDVTLTPEIEAITIIDSESTERRDNVNDYNANTTNHKDWEIYWEAYYNTWGLRLSFAEWYPTAGVSAGDIYEITLNDKTCLYTIQVADVLSQDALGGAMATFIRTNYPTLTLVNYSAGWLYLIGATTLTSSRIYEPSGITRVALTKKRDFKSGAWHPFCIYYYDKALRRWDAQTSKDSIDGTAAWSADGTTVYVPMYGEYSPLPSDIANKWNISWSVNHLPPDGAKYWRWGYAGNALCSEFVQYTVSIIQDEGTLTKLNITPLQTLKAPTDGTWNEFPQSIIDPWSWQKGDRVRVITEKSNGTAIGGLIDGVYDFEIIKYDDTTVAGEYWIYTQQFGFNAINAGEDSIIEIYRPKKSDTAKVFYEFGELMPILKDANDIWVHGSGVTGTQNQDTVLGVAAEGVFTAGDIYKILRTPSKPIDGIDGYFHESMWYSDFYDSDDWDKGRIGVETTFGERFLNIIRFSDQYIQNTKINGLSTFDAINYKEISDMHGEIVGMVEVGNTLKVYMEKKSASILIGRQEYTDDNGQITVSQSSVVLGSVRYPENSFGTQFIESIEKNNRFVYGFDALNAVAWRDSANGIFPISGRYSDAGVQGDYKMASWFKEKADALMYSGIANVNVTSVWDENYKLLYFIFKDKVNSDNNATIVYHEPSDRWITFAEFEKTYEEGWNEMLELEWSVLSGFDGGATIFFNEDTRFTEFDFITSKQAKGFPSRQDIQYITYSPAVTIAADAATSLIPYQYSILSPSPIVSYVHIGTSLLSYTLTFSYDADGEAGEEQYLIINSAPYTCYISSISDPSWVDIKNSGDLKLQVYSIITSGDQLKICPNSINTGAQRQCIVTIRNSSPYTETVTLTIIQEVSVIDPTVSLLISDDSVNNLTLSGITTFVATGGITCQLWFTPDHANHTPAETYTIFWYAYLNGNYVGSGSFTATDNAANYQAITINTAPAYGEVVYVYFSVVDYGDKSATTTLSSLSYVQYNATGLVTRVWANVVDMSWLATESGDAVKLDSTITATGEDAYLSAIPSWIRVVDSVGNPIILYNIPITDGDIISIYPDSNNFGEERTGVVTIENNRGDTISITVTQAKPSVPGVTELTSYIVIDSNDYYLYLTEDHSYATDATVAVNIRFIPHIYTYGDGEYFQVYWRLSINGTASSVGSLTVQNNVLIDTNINLAIIPTVGDEIMIELSTVYVYPSI